MCGRLLPTLLAVLTTLVLGAGTAPAATVTAGLRVTPGGSFTGTGGPVNGPFSCASSRIAGLFNSSGGALGIIDEVAYQNCSGGFFTVSVSVDLPWRLVAVAHANGVTHIDITGMAATVSGPGCHFEVEGRAATSYANATGTLTVHRDNSVVTFVDPAANCLGLVSPGQYAALLSRSYAIAPRQIIELA